MPSGKIHLVAREHPTPTERYHHGDLRKALILGAAELIEEQGLLAFSMIGAARRVGVSSAAPYRHFRDKNDLLNAVTDLAFLALSNEVEAAADQHEAGTERCIAALGSTYMRFLVEHQPFYELMWGKQGAELSAEEHIESRTSGFRLLISTLALWCDRRGITHRRPEELALGFWSMAHGMSVLQSHKAFTYFGHDADIEAMLRTNTKAFLLGIAATQSHLDDPVEG